MVKLADNQWIDLNVALANELAILCDSIDGNIDVMEVIQGQTLLRKVCIMSIFYHPLLESEVIALQRSLV